MNCRKLCLRGRHCASSGLREWVVTLQRRYITFLQSPQQPGVLWQQNTTLLCHPPAVTPCSRFHKRREKPIILHPCSPFLLLWKDFGEVSGAATEQWKKPGRCSGRCEFAASERVEFGKRRGFLSFDVTHVKPKKRWWRRALNPVGCSWLLWEEKKGDDLRSLPWTADFTSQLDKQRRKKMQRIKEKGKGSEREGVCQIYAKRSRITETRSDILCL